MNCKDYKEAIAAEPSQQFDDASHADACESCATFRDEILALDHKISRALKIKVPDLVMPELPAIGDDDNVVNLPFRRGRMTAPAWIGLAASVLLVTILGVRFASDDVVYGTLAEEIVAHFDNHQAGLAVTNVGVSEQTLANVVEDDIEQMDIGLITFASSCDINGNLIPHLVIQGERGPITILLLPDEKISSAVQIDGIGIRGVILPVGNGSIAIIGDRNEPLERVEKQVVNSVKWST
jgi:hypothetical protein